jgi:hypothetical protein
MRFRKRRIAWSILWGVASVLLIVLWVRSYRWIDQATANLADTQIFCIASRCGTLGFAIGSRGPTDEKGLSLDAFLIPSEDDDIVIGIYPFGGLDNKAKFGFERASDDTALFMPHWFVVLITSMLTAATWIRWRFSYVGACQVTMGFYMFALRSMSLIARFAQSLITRSEARNSTDDWCWG